MAYKETITMRQAFSIIALFIFGNTVIMGLGSETDQDSWISVLLAYTYGIPFLLIYARIMRLYPQKDIFELFHIVFGKICGKIFIALISWYALHMCTLVLVNFSQFVYIMAMPETPQLPLMIVITAITAYLAFSGVETLGKWSLLTLPVFIFFFFLTTIISIPQMDFSNLLPFMEHDFSEIASSSFKVFSFPLAETVLFLGIAGSVKQKTSPYKLYYYAAAFGGIISLLAVLRMTVILGPLVKIEYFPSYIEARIFNVGDFLTRIEGSISMNFIISGITKMTVCLLVAVKGITHLFGIANYRRILIPVTLLVIALGSILFESAMEMFAWLKVYQYYALPFQIAIPIFLWLFAEIKVRRQKKLAVGVK